MVLSSLLNTKHGKDWAKSAQKPFGWPEGQTKTLVEEGRDRNTDRQTSEAYRLNQSWGGFSENQGKGI